MTWLSKICLGIKVSESNDITLSPDFKIKLYVINCLHSGITCAQSMSGLAQLAHTLWNTYRPPQGRSVQAFPSSTPGLTSVTVCSSMLLHT